MKLYIIENDATVDYLLAMPEYDPEKDVIVCFNYLPYDKLMARTEGHNVHFIEEYLSKEDYENLHSVTDHFAGQWYMINGKDATLFDGISFGDITQIMLSRTYMMSILVKYGEAIRRLVEEHREIDCIWYDLSNTSNSFFFNRDDGGRYFDKEGLVKSVAEQLNVKSRFLKSPRVIPPVFIGSIGFDMEERPVIKRRLFNAFRLLLLRWIERVRRFLGNCNERIYFFNYFNIDSLSDKAGTDFIFSTSDRKRFSTLIRSFDFDDIHYELNDEEKEFINKLQRCFIHPCSNDRLGRFEYNGIDYSLLYLKAIEDIVVKHIPLLLKYYHQAQKGIEDFNIGKLVLVDVMTERGRTLVEACRNVGCKSVFVDHGIMGYRFAQRSSKGYAPDLIIKPDDMDTNSNGYPYMIKSKSIQLGNPSTDPYPENRRKKISSIRTILMHTFSDNFYARLDRFQYQEAYFRELLLAIPRLCEIGMTILYRPHRENPKYHQYLFNYFNIDPSMVIMSDFSKPFRELIYEVDLLICNISNTYYESLAAGIPVIFLEPILNADCLYPPLSGESWEEVIRVSTSDEIVGIVKKNKDGPDELNDFMENYYRRYAKKNLYKLDGMAGKRIADYLSKN